MACLIELVDSGEYDVTHKNRTGDNALELLARCGCLSFARFDNPSDLCYSLTRVLLQRGMDWKAALYQRMWPQTRTISGVTLLKLVVSYAASNQQQLVPSINATDSNGQTAFHWAVDQPQLGTAKVLLTNECICDIDFTIKDKTGRTEERLAMDKHSGANSAHGRQVVGEILHLIHHCHDSQRSYFRPLLRESVAAYTHSSLMSSISSLLTSTPMTMLIKVKVNVNAQRDSTPQPA